MNNKKTWIAVVVLAVLIVAALMFWFVFKPETIDGLKEITVEVTHGDGGTNSYTFSTKKLYLYDALWEQKLIGPLVDGYFTELDGETADTQQEQWWGYTKRGEYVNYGVSECVIENGDHYEFTFNVGW